jgi:Streptomyces sporulation and cell division protein, SsgA
MPAGARWTSGTDPRPTRIVVTPVTLERALPSPSGKDTVVEMPGELRFEPTDPFAVTLTVLAPGSPVRWKIARDLLLHGCYERVGEGDVRIEPGVDAAGRAVVLIRLDPPRGSAVLTTPTVAIVDFLDRVLAAVPIGTESEHLDVDRVIHLLLQES